MVQPTRPIQWLTIGDVAEWLAVSEPTIRNWIRDGVFPVYRANPRGKILISESDVIEAMQRRRIVPRSWGRGMV